MASPRVFVSSTCYDLHDLRNNLYNFIKTFDYEPVMSEFGDIFFDYNMNVQDACLREITKCQMFVLIIGNNYGSYYHNIKSTDKNLKSVTMKEFEKALEEKIPKHIFINKMVKYDYDNYRRFLDAKYKSYFSSNTVENDQINMIKATLRDEFDETYHFPNESYKHIFRFIDSINELVLNNAIYTYENTIDIQNQLKKQWANFMYESLIGVINNNYLEEESKQNNQIFEKISKIEATINGIIENKDGIISFDTSNIIRALDISNMAELQKKLASVLENILYNKYGNSIDKSRGYFIKPLTEDDVHTWLESLDDLIISYKWSKNIPFNVVFDCIGGQNNYDNYINLVPYESLNELFAIYSNFEDEKKNLVKTVNLELNRLYQDVPF